MEMLCGKSLAAVSMLALALGIAACAKREAARISPDPPALSPDTRLITVDADRKLGECYRFWTVTNVVEPHTLADPDGIPDLAGCTPLMKSVNCDFMMGGMWEGKNQWFLGSNSDGSIRTDFTGMIAQLKAIQDAGFRPAVVFEDVPDNMSDPPRRYVYGNTAPPKDEHIWHAYVQAAVEAMVRAFGAEKVKTWTFRVGTEPDLFPAHWSGTEAEYLAHYDFTVDALRRALPGARVGPGNILQQDGQPVPGRRSGNHPKWGLDIIDHCATGKNACTGAVGTPMDVFSTSWYENVGMPTDAFNFAINAIQDRLNKYPQFKNVPIEVTEFSVLRDERGKHLYAGEASEWSASFFASLADRAYALGVKQVYEWDHATLGVFHPRGRVLQMLDKMAGGARLQVKVQAKSDAESGAIACRQGDDLWLLVYNHRPERGPPKAEPGRLEIHDRRMTRGASWRLSEWTIDHDHGVWAYAFEADAKAAGLEPLSTAGFYEGSPKRLYGDAGVALFKKNAAKYTALSQVPLTKDNVPLPVGDGAATIDIDLAGHSVRFIRLSPRSQPGKTY